MLLAAAGQHDVRDKTQQAVYPSILYDEQLPSCGCSAQCTSCMMPSAGLHHVHVPHGWDFQRRCHAGLGYMRRKGRSMWFTGPDKLGSCRSSNYFTKVTSSDGWQHSAACRQPEWPGACLASLELKQCITEQSANCVTQ
jgi:hypothetical protein